MERLPRGGDTEAGSTELKRTRPWAEEILHLISVLGGMWQIMFTQGDKSFSLKKEKF